MSRAEVFLLPGELAARLFLEIFGSSEAGIRPEFFTLLAFVLAMFAWGIALRVVLAILKKIFGFDQGTRR